MNNSTCQRAAALLLCCLLIAGGGSLQAADHAARFKVLKALKWKQVFSDPGSGTWKDLWFVDGKKATITNGSTGMNFCAGPIYKEDASHAVLWTKQDFTGDLKIEYDYTKTDNVYNNTTVTIIYVQATGINRNRDGTFWDKDIVTWSDRRTVPSMSYYFKYTNALHISYAAYEKNDNQWRDYIRARRYPCAEPNCNFSSTTLITPDYLRPGMFEKGVTYHVTIIKKSREFYMHARGTAKENLFPLNYDRYPEIHEGRIGLRHMYTRCARYKNFRVFTLDTSSAPPEPVKVLSVVPQSATSVIVRFDMAVEQVSAETISNYALTNGGSAVTISAAIRQSDRNSVVLTVSSLAKGTCLLLIHKVAGETDPSATADTAVAFDFSGSTPDSTAAGPFYGVRHDTPHSSGRSVTHLGRVAPSRSSALRIRIIGYADAAESRRIRVLRF